MSLSTFILLPFPKRSYLLICRFFFVLFLKSSTYPKFIFSKTPWPMSLACLGTGSGHIWILSTKTHCPVNAIFIVLSHILKLNKLIGHWECSWTCPKYLTPCHPLGRLRWSSWPRPSSYLGWSSDNSVCMCLFFPFLCSSPFQINEN